jgi:hydrogenase maturation protease
VTAVPTPGIRLVVCGNTDRGDDGLALQAAASLVSALSTAVRAAVDIRWRAELRVEDLLDIRPGDRCLILDAVSGARPGQVVVLPLDRLGDQRSFSPRSSHELPIGLVVGLAETLRAAPLQGTFLGLGGARWGFGDAPSPAALAGLPAFQAAIEDELVRSLVSAASAGGT